MEEREDLLISDACIAGKIVEVPKKGYLYIDLEKAKDYWLKGGMFREIALNAGYEESELVPVKNEWESKFYGKEIKGYYVYQFSEIRECAEGKACITDMNLFKTEKQAKSALAYAQLTQLMALPEYNGDWVADWTDGSSKYCIVPVNKKLMVDLFYEYAQKICFKSRELAEIFLANNLDLIKQFNEMD